MFDDEQMQKLADLKAVAPPTKIIHLPVAEKAAAAAAAQEAALMPKEIPPGMPNLPTMPGTILAYASKPWHLDKPNVRVTGTEHVWWMLVPNTKLPEVKEALHRRTAAIFHTTPVAGEFAKAYKRSAGAFMQKTAGRTPMMNLQPTSGTFLVIGWLEV